MYLLSIQKSHNFSIILFGSVTWLSWVVIEAGPGLLSLLELINSMFLALLMLSKFEKICFSICGLLSIVISITSFCLEIFITLTFNK